MIYNYYSGGVIYEKNVVQNCCGRTGSDDALHTGNERISAA